VGDAAILHLRGRKVQPSFQPFPETLGMEEVRACQLHLTAGKHSIARQPGCLRASVLLGIEPRRRIARVELMAHRVVSLRCKHSAAVGGIAPRTRHFASLVVADAFAGR